MAALFYFSFDVQQGCGVTKRTMYRVLATLAVVLMVSQSLAGAQQQSSSAGSGVAEARTLLKAKRFQEALAILRPLAEAHPGRNDVHFLVGLAALESSRAQGVGKADREALLDESIASFRTMLVDEPALVRVRLELARAFFYKEEDSLSKENFERVLAGNPPEPVLVASSRVHRGSKKAPTNGILGLHSPVPCVSRSNLCGLGWHTSKRESAAVRFSVFSYERVVHTCIAPWLVLSPRHSNRYKDGGEARRLEDSSNGKEELEC